MSNYAVRNGARINLVADDWGTEVSFGIADQVREQLVQEFGAMGLTSTRDFSSTPKEDIDESSPGTQMILEAHGRKGLEELRKPIVAFAYHDGSSEPRSEPVLIDDGGTVIEGERQGEFDRTLKIAVRDARGKNSEVRELVASVLMSHGVSVYDALKGGESADQGTEVFGLKRTREEFI